MDNSNYSPIFELTRGSVVESVHYGSIAIVDPQGRLHAWYGNPAQVTYLRSSAKPFQALPLLESGGQKAFDLNLPEIAIICASHSGTDEHAGLVAALQAKAGLNETDLLCGIHPPYDEATQAAMRQRGEAPTSNRHNCSGKHSGMLALSRMQGLSLTDYINPSHPVQHAILQAFAEMCDLSMEQVQVGIDGCSAPNFAVPLVNAALAYARLCDPVHGKVTPHTRAAACQFIVNAMIAHPYVVAGPGRFDTRLMNLAQGRLISKGGAEGYQGIGLLPGALGPDSPALGIALKIADGDVRSRACPAVSLEVLRQLGALSPEELGQMADIGPSQTIFNWRGIPVGVGRPCFDLVYAH